MKGKLIVFEGIDGSGKSTQFQLMCSRLVSEGAAFKRLRFPRYDAPSSALIRLYLDGSFGSRPEDVNPYAASAFYAVDRFASYAEEWRADYLSGGLFLADRYTTSNAIHQAAKLPVEKRAEFFAWLEDFEYGRMELPAPDAVFYMDVPPGLAAANLAGRQAKTGETGDIHETHRTYLERCVEAAELAADYYGWMKVPCAENGRMRDADSLHGELYARMRDYLL